MKSSDCLVQCLENEGVQYIFGVPGEENLDFLQSLATSHIRFITTRNEQTAVFMASTYGRLTGKAGVALATLGPGASNMLTGIAHAQLGAMPLIVITGQKPIKTSKQSGFQIIDVPAMMKPVTKWSTSIVDGSRIPSMVRQAFKLAEAERPGAVHLELAEDIASQEIVDTCQPLTAYSLRRPEIDQKMCAQLVTLIKSARLPLILIGSGANRKRISKYLTKFILKTGIPFFSSQMGKGVVDESLPSFIGTAALTSKDHIHRITSQADLIIAIGYDPVEKPAMFVDYDHQKLIHINFFPAVVDEVYQPSLEAVGDIANTCRQLYESDLDASVWDYTDLMQEIAHMHTLVYQASDADALVMGPHQLARDLRTVMAAEDILALDNGLYKLRLARNYPAYSSNTVLLDNALATMGAGYSIAMTAKILYPQHHVVTVVGDGGLMMNLGDLETIVRLGLDLVIIVLNDGAYGMIKRKQKDGGFDDFALDFNNPDFVKLAESFGARGIRLGDKSRFKDILAESLHMKGLTIIDIPFVYPDAIN